MANSCLTKKGDWVLSHKAIFPDRSTWEIVTRVSKGACATVGDQYVSSRISYESSNPFSIFTKVQMLL